MFDFFPLAVILTSVAPVDTATPQAAPAVGPMAIEAPRDWPFDGAVLDPAPPVFQLRIDQRVIIRVPRTRSTTRQALSDLRALPPRAPKYIDRKFGKCIAMDNIAGVQIGEDDDLMLYLRDRRLVRAELEKSCRGRDFYSGFYMEMTKDGQFCRDRDMLHSRSGTKCEVEDMRQLLPDDDD